MKGTDQNLLFGVIAMQSDLITREQFVDASTLWASHKEMSMAEILVSQSWMTQADAQYVEGLLAQRLRRQRVANKEVTEELSDVNDTPLEREKTAVMAESRNRREQEREPISTSRRDRIALRSLYSAGGIGEVWRAHDRVLDREVALKKLKIRKQTSPAHKERFFREACITGQLDHPGIVPVYDYQENADSDECYYTMRFVQGRTLTQVIDEYHRRRTKEGPSAAMGNFLKILGHFLSVCNTLAFAHSRQVIHRDLKGDNIIVGDFGEVIVLDWGLAKRLSSSPSMVSAQDLDEATTSVLETVSVMGEGSSGTIQGEQLGTPAYMAPEQAQGRIDLIDYRTDVYGLAALLYEILTGRPPFRSDTVIGVMRKVVSTPPKPPSDVIGGVPVGLEKACLKGLAKERRNRQQSVAQLASDVQNWLIARAERQRAEMEREHFFDLSLDLLAILEQGDRFIQTNAAWESILGWTHTDLQAECLSRFVVAEDTDHVHQSLTSVWSMVPHIEFEARCRRASGDYRWVHWSARKIPGEFAIYLVGRDITERKQSEQKFQGILESAPDAMCVVDGSGVIVLVNAQLEQMFGYDRDELLGEQLDILIPEHLRAPHKHHLARFLANPSPRPMAAGLDLYGERRDGTIFHVEISLSPVATEEGLLISCALRDSTHRQREQERLKEIVDCAPDAMVVVDENRAIQLINRQAELLFGYDRVELVGRPVEVLVPEAMRTAHERAASHYIGRPINRPMATESRQVQGLCKDGTLVRLDIRLSPVDTESGLMICTIMRAVDETSPADA